MNDARSGYSPNDASLVLFGPGMATATSTVTPQSTAIKQPLPHPPQPLRRDGCSPNNVFSVFGLGMFYYSYVNLFSEN
jgi:hypothetical protein